MPVRSALATGARHLALACLAALVAGCESAPFVATEAPPTPSAQLDASGTAVVRSPWTDARVALPGDVTASPSASGIFCSPCHGTSSYVTGITTAPFGLVAVGFDEPEVRAAAWVSTDGSSWTGVRDLEAEEGSAIEAVTADAGRVVAVGKDAAGATSWTTTDGIHWTRSADSPAMSGPRGSTAMLAVIPYASGFVAAGFSDDPAAGTSSAAVWTSTDGLAWSRVVGQGADALTGGRIVGLAANEGTIVAVGTAGDANRGPAAVWTSADGARWTTQGAADFSLGAMRAVAAGSHGFVAVGQTAADGGAVAWLSADGRNWQAARDQPALHYYQLPVRMQAVTWAASLYVAVGYRSDAGNGSAVAWTSPDGREWSIDAAALSFSGAEMTAVTATPGAAPLPPGVVAAGERGLPDNGSASVWLRFR